MRASHTPPQHGAVRVSIPQGGGYNPVQMMGVKESVYAVAMSEHAGVVAAGTTGKVIRIADPRTGCKVVGLLRGVHTEHTHMQECRQASACTRAHTQMHALTHTHTHTHARDTCNTHNPPPQVMKLRGHSGNIRALLLDAGGGMMLSGSSDHSVRLWDLGQQRCVHTFVVHTDSVWALGASPSFEVVYSGGKDKRVYRWVCMWVGVGGWALERGNAAELRHQLLTKPLEQYLLTTPAGIHRLALHLKPTSPPKNFQNGSRVCVAMCR